MTRKKYEVLLRREAVSLGPQTETRIFDEIDFFPLHAIETVLKLGRIVKFHLYRWLCVLVNSLSPFFAIQMPRRPDDLEAVFGGSVNQMRRGAEIGCQIVILADHRERCFCPVITVFSDQFVDLGILAELAHAWSKNDQLSTVFQRHASAVNRLVSKPGAVKFSRIEINHDLAQRFGHEDKVHLEAQLRSEMKAFRIVPNEQAARDRDSRCVSRHNRQHINNWEAGEKMRGGVIQHTADWIVRAPHDALHTVHGAKIVAAVDAVGSARSDQNVFVVVRHADNFVRDDLAEGKNEIELATGNQPIYLRRPVVVQSPFRLFTDEIPGNDPDRFHILSPLVGVKEGARNLAKHRQKLFR